MNLCEEYLSARGITDETVKIHGLELDRFNAKRAKDRLGLTLAGNGIIEVIWFPLVIPNGSIKSWIARPLPTIAGGPKFLAPLGSNAAPFVPRSVYDLSHGKPVIITEGPVKALACVQAGFDAIGLNGVWGAARKNSQDLYVISADLHKALDWRGRKVYAAFDADLNINPNVRQALIRLYLVLAASGAELYQLSWDLSEGKGIDDWLVGRLRSNGHDQPEEVLKALLADAKPFVETIQRTSLDLGLIYSELIKVYLPDLLRSQICKDLARQLGVPVDDLRGVGRSQPAANAPSYATDPAPWPDPIDGEGLLHDLAGVVKRHVVIDDHSVVATVLWTILSYCADLVDTLPLLVVLSPARRCGKSRLLTVLDRLVRRAMSVVLITPATVYRSIEQFHPSLLLDEADTLFRDSHGNENGELRAIFNSGFTRDQAWVPRCVGENAEVELFSTWAPKVVALVGKLPDTIYDRSIPIRLKRRSKSEVIKAF
jgi:hypothetical protein